MAARREFRPLSPAALRRRWFVLAVVLLSAALVIGYEALR